ncbi:MULTISPECIES: prepilin-type N-terminal cleavage/methylation domain-containing protein [unclassified Pseudomonas]|uniref:prepilin-type N-terminal cleavage/methylation domain-containing protein n=1 Tax=unclassified Pseudomonas TaxID=196821 RepID=UPI002AC9D74F|nr:MULTISPECIES: prepilin-type N-terminal cleavage/methylation domain-containing protein [unclassified Pseudomonas]MEB0048382.1 prepilin-type N-terminal cleavage/methylation domain-containing protein [Pseudomonas sp. Dout3]MEB0097562.1 prepilin-type N-terminal cleavage/methylation domain-containing protein [Pseudomonas sp. DC1.2]WPX56752.1 prepilin-type N-terminal cleavage/methylation domain-containing protein [Pseudomonas sp. DC1.2]
MKRQQGFTLIEVMVAIMLMAIVSVIAWRGLDSVTRADAHLQASTEQTEALLRTLNQLERDVAMRASIELSEPAKPGVDDDPPPTAPAALTVRSTDGKGFRLDVIRSAADGHGGLQRVRWWLKGDALYRAVAEARSQYPLPAPMEGVAVLTQVSAATLRVWETDKGWRSLSGNRQENPLGIEISVTRQTPQGPEKYRQVMGPLD